MGVTHIRIKGLMKRFRQTLAVDHLNLEIERGSFTTLLGPSGCGKTTTLRMIAGFIEPDDGDIYLDDRLLTRVPAHKRDVAMVFQSYALFPHMTVFDNVAYGLRQRKTSRRGIRQKVDEVLGLMDMTGMESRRPGQLSGGQQQRVAVARALAVEPEALLMDEPLSNLDAKLRVSIRNEIKKLQHRLGITTIYVTHDQEEALSMSDTIALLKDGRLQQVASPQEIYDNPVNRFVADFIGATNFLECKVASVVAECVELDVGNMRLIMKNCGHDLRRGQRALVNIRPESIRISEASYQLEADNLLKGTISDVSYLGRLARYWVALEGGQTIMVEQLNPRIILSDEVLLAFDGSELNLLPDSVRD